MIRELATKIESQGGDTLDLIQTDLIAGAIIELGGPG